VAKDHSAQRRVAIYLRVSTGEQTTDNQRRELEAVAARHGWRVVDFFEYAGISGAKGRDKRPGLDRLLKAVARRDVDMVAAWSVDRLGRSLMIALAATEIVMGRHSNLGPIDPQIGNRPAIAILAEFEKARTEITADPKLALLWQPILQQYPPTLLSFAIRQSNGREKSD
jgi:DNA invertase Pin-like site-specific DNA recombinase